MKAHGACFHTRTPARLDAVHDGSPSILLVEDDTELRSQLLDALRGSGFRVTPCELYAEAESHIHGANADFDLILLDLWLPDRNGLDLCRELRFAGNMIPVIILTARDGSDEVVRGLDVGADDYVIKPFRTPELFARIRSVLRRAQSPSGRAKLQLGPLVLNAETRRAWLDTEELQLKPREFDLLQFFMRHPGRAWTRSQLLERVWGPSFEGDDRTVDMHVARLRALLEANPRNPEWIQTVWRVGYRFRESKE